MSGYKKPHLPIAQLRFPSQLQNGWELVTNDPEFEAIDQLRNGWKHTRYKMETSPPDLYCINFREQAENVWDVQRAVLAQLGYITNSLFPTGLGRWKSLKPVIGNKSGF